MKYHLPTDGGSRPLPRGIKGSVLISERKPYYEVGISRTDAGTGNKGGTAGEEDIRARPFISHDGTGVFQCPPNQEAAQRGSIKEEEYP